MGTSKCGEVSPLPISHFLPSKNNKGISNLSFQAFLLWPLPLKYWLFQFLLFSLAFVAVLDDLT
jgi:hypothetical protein